MNWDLFIQLMVNGVIVGSLYGIVAMCFVLIYKATKVVNFAQGELLLIGAWVCWTMIAQWQFNFFISFLICLAFMAIFGILIQIVVLRPMIGEPIISVIMVTIGLSTFFQAGIKWVFGVDAKAFPTTVFDGQIEIFGLSIHSAYAMSFVAALVIMGLFFYFFKYSRWGLAMRATAWNQQVAQSMGISVKQVFAISWAISAFVSAIAGVVFGIVTTVSDSLAFIGIKVFPAVILGGLDSIIGAIVGGLIVGLLENGAEFVDSQYLQVGNMYSIAPFYVLVIILMIKPYGLFGTKDIERV